MRRRPEREFYFRLAGYLGYTVEELLARISSRELSEWIAFEKRAGPLGQRRGDIHMAVITSAIYNVNRKKGSKAIDPEKLLPKWDDYQSDEDMWAQIRAANAELGGTVADEPSE
ncbi:phage tail assembly protein T [Streptomonospora wellingtoniae]|uniref:Minor tail T domain-containing protein n=1 Tax=Streptomonospora wellingtoniae TaxID=3075544 RepID=A0ABU2L0H5_9ACTN|nr:hypothetical protein [Streptomonospora sp. DSM 45055]MDT0305060.1 hypothetical protein [Streptomonospora sp. DSM 45055]